MIKFHSRDSGGSATPPFDTDFMVFSSDFSLKYCIFIVTAPPFCLATPRDAPFRRVCFERRHFSVLKTHYPPNLLRLFKSILIILSVATIRFYRIWKKIFGIARNLLFFRQNLTNFDQFQISFLKCNRI